MKEEIDCFFVWQRNRPEQGVKRPECLKKSIRGVCCDKPARIWKNLSKNLAKSQIPQMRKILGGNDL